jgi:hypothetical protein
LGVPSVCCVCIWEFLQCVVCAFGSSFSVLCVHLGVPSVCLEAGGVRVFCLVCSYFITRDPIITQTY